MRSGHPLTSARGGADRTAGRPSEPPGGRPSSSSAGVKGEFTCGHPSLSCIFLGRKGKWGWGGSFFFFFSFLQPEQQLSKRIQQSVRRATGLQGDKLAGSVSPVTICCCGLEGVCFGGAAQPSSWASRFSWRLDRSTVRVVFWKVLFAFVPPTEYWNGWACFIVSISLIGALTAVTGDLASHFGCTVGLKDSVTAVVFVALGTSVPDTFASKVAAIQDQYADASIGNVTGSNAVNVFLGIGVAWTIAAVVWRARGQTFQVDPGSLAFSVTLFTILASICVATLLYRRRGATAGGELGGPRTCKLLTSLFFVSLWLVYILLASLEAYCHLPAL